MPLTPEKLSALLPCPFCGGEAEFQPATAHDNASIVCRNDCCDYWAGTDEIAIAGWNRRPREIDLLDLVQAQADRIAGLTGALEYYAKTFCEGIENGCGHLHEDVCSGCRAYAALSAPTPTDNRKPGSEPRRLPRLLGERRITDNGGPDLKMEYGATTIRAPNNRFSERRKA